MDSDYSVSIKKYGLWVNDTHRLVYLIGRYQRIKDSILNMPSKMNGKLSSEFFPLVKDRRLEGKKFVNRKLSELAKIDGNIVGEIFSLDVHEYYSQDMKRRRSFRFNSHWWDSLFTAMQETEFIAGDPIAQYAAAGDDILLGHYSISGREDENFLLFYLEKLSKQVQKRLNIELKNAVGNKNDFLWMNLDKAAVNVSFDTSSSNNPGGYATNSPNYSDGSSGSASYVSATYNFLEDQITLAGKPYTEELFESLKEKHGALAKEVVAFAGAP